MSLSSLISGAVKTMKDATSSLQVEVSHEVFDRDASTGVRSYKSAVKRKAIVERNDSAVRVNELWMQVPGITIQFLEPVVISQDDLITLPDGTKPPIMSIEGVLDPTGAYYAPRVFCSLG